LFSFTVGFLSYRSSPHAVLVPPAAFCNPVAPSSMLFMCLLLRAVFNFGWPSLINKVHAAVALDRLEVFKRVCTLICV